MASSKKQESLVGSDGFLKIDEPFILIAGSSDVREEKMMAQRVVQDVLQEYRRQNIAAYTWETHGELDQRRSMQRSIPRPSSNNCLGVIYIQGERIGLPLEDGFDVSIIEGLEGWTNSEDYRLLVDWPDDLEEISERVDEGYYPLTGGVFEFLDAHSHRSEDFPNGKPVWFCLLADREVPAKGPEIAINGNRWFNSQTAGMNPLERKEWEHKEYKEQFCAVHNWIRAISNRGINQNPIASQEVLRQKVSEFVIERILLKQRSGNNPYRELKYYDIGHGERFYGRKDLVETCVTHLLDRFKDMSRVPVIRLIGASGSGKSSVLRAGILREITSLEEQGRFHVVALRPEDFIGSTGQRKSTVFTILESIVKQTQLNIPNDEVLDAISRGADAPKRTAEVISDALCRSVDSNEKLIIGLDQFEEIVDMLSGQDEEIWQPLLQFVDEAIQFTNIGFIYTLESSRKTQHDILKLGMGFSGAHEEKVELDSVFFERVIYDPFFGTGYNLASNVIEELKVNIRRMQDGENQVTQDSVLPLLALRLHYLWEYVSEAFEPGISKLQFVEGQDAITIQKLKGYDLGFKDIIQKQADKAWKFAKVGEISQDALDYFLLPLVGLNGERIQLRSAPLKAPYRIEQSLIQSFKHHRLIVGVGDGLVRFVHEAVLKHWKEANIWCEDRREFLETRAQFRHKAIVWKSEGRPKIRRTNRIKKEVDEVAIILGYYIRHWTFDIDNIPEEDLLLREYCLAVFSHSRTPEAPVIYSSGPRGNHVNLAASYGMVHLLERYKKDFDVGCLNKLSDESPSTPLHKASWGQLEAVKFLLENGASPFLPASGWMAIAGAIQMGRKDIFLILMESALKLVSKDSLEKELLCPNDRTLLHLTAHYDNANMAEDLIDHYSFSVQSRDRNGWLPIYHASLNNSLKVFDLLSRYIPATDELEQLATCLIIAAVHGSTSIVDRVLSHSNREKILTSTGKYHAIYYALKNHQPGSVRLLLRHVNLNSININPFKVMLVDGNSNEEEIEIEELLETISVVLEDPRIDVNAAIQLNDLIPLPDADRFRRMIIESIQNNEYITIEKLNEVVDIKGLQENVDLDKMFENVDLDKLLETFGFKNSNGVIDTDKMLGAINALRKDPRFNINNLIHKEITPLALASKIGRAQRLLLEDARIDLAKPIFEEGETGFFLALKLGVWSSVRRFIREHGLPEGLDTDDQGNTMLHLLTKPNAPTDLIEAQINQASEQQLNAVNKKGQTPFMRALNAKNWNLAIRMIETNKLKMERVSHGSMSELFIALRNEAPDRLLKEMVAAKPNLIVEKDCLGWTILHHIAANNHLNWAKRISPFIKENSAWSIADSWERRPLGLSSTNLQKVVVDHDEDRERWNGYNWDAHAGWHKADKDSAKIYMKKVKEVLKKAGEGGRHTKWVVERGVLSFYPGSSIFKVHAGSWDNNNRFFYFLVNSDEIFYLNGTSPPIYTFNEEYKIQLNKENILDYLRFFCFFVRGEDGPFFIFDHFNKNIFNEQISVEDLELLSKESHSSFVINEVEDRFECVARVLYGNGLFGAYFSIQPTGMVEMREDIPIHSNLSGQINLPIT